MDVNVCACNLDVGESIWPLFYFFFWFRCGLQIPCAVNDDDDKLRILSSFALRCVEEMEEM